MDETLDLVRRISVSLSVKLSHILAFFVKYKQASSFGAIAGFAIALICTWRYFRGALLRGRRGKRQPPAARSAADAGTEAIATGVTHGITQVARRGAPVASSAAPAQLTLASIVRRQLNGGRRATCQVAGVLLHEGSPEALQGGATVRAEAVEVVKELASACDLYLLARVLDDGSQDAVLAALDSAGLFAPGAVNRHKVLFCATEVGLVSFVRQLEPDWHIDSAATAIDQLKRFVRHELHIAAPGEAVVAANVVSTPTLERYFGLPA